MIDISDLTKSFGVVEAFRDISLQAGAGEILWLRGVSGSGKTSLLRCVAGLETPDSGTIKLDGRLVSDPTDPVPPHRRGVGMVFQDLALWPHKTVEGHLRLVLRAAGFRGAEMKNRIAELLELSELAPRRRALPAQLSGGQCQRLAFIRAIASRPKILLLDEPFSNLDERLRNRMMAELRRMTAVEGTTIIMASHDGADQKADGDRELRLSPRSASGAPV